MKKIRVLIGGSPYHAHLLSEELNSFIQGIEAKEAQPSSLENKLRKFNHGIEAKEAQPPWPDNRLRRAIPQLTDTDIFHGIYWEDCYRIFFAAKLLRKKTVCHWIGTDVYTVLRNRKRRLAIKLLDKFIDVHIAGSPGLVDELKEIGIEASWMPIIPPVIAGQVQPFPSSLTVLSYILESRTDFYGASIVRQLAAHFQDIKFVIVGDTGAGVVSPSNMTYLGYLKDMDKVYKNTSVLLRIVEHDGLSLMVLEALARGKQVIWCQPFPHCYYAKDFATAKDALSSIIKKPVINYGGVSYVQEEFNTTKILGKLANIYEELINKEKHD